MTKAVFNPIEPGDLRTAGAFNGILQSYEGASTNVGRDNVREEGLDERPLTATAARRRPFSPLVIPGDDYFNSTVFLCPNIDGVFVQSAGFTLSAGEFLRVLCAFELITDPGAPVGLKYGVREEEIFEARIVVRRNGVETPQTHSIRRLGVGPGGGLTVGAHAPITIDVAVDAPSGTYDWVRLEARTQTGGDARIGHVTLLGIVYRNYVGFD